MRLPFIVSSGLALLVAGPASATSIIFPDFSSTAGLTLSGYAQETTTAQDGAVIQLTPAGPSEVGNVYSTATINASNFSTVFQFRITDPGGIIDSSGQSGADGLTFIVQSVSNTSGGVGSGAGYAGISNSVGVKFDTYQNGAPQFDPSSNFVGIYTDGSVTSTGVPTANVSPDFDDGNLWTAWVDYDGTTLSVYAGETTTKPATPLVSEALNIPSLLGQDTAYVGFGASTGAAWENTYVTTWQYSDTFAPDIGPATVPEPASMLFLGTSVIALATLRARTARS